MNKVLNTLNGKKLPIALITFIIMTSIGYGELKQKVATLETVMADLKEIPAQIARIETNGEHQEKNLDKVDKKLDQILEVLMR